MKGSLRLSTYNMISCAHAYYLCGLKIMNVPPRQAIVYLIQGPSVTDRYVGCTHQGIDIRLQKHKSRARRGERPLSKLYNAMRAQGVDNFHIQQIVAVDPNDCSRAEREQILALRTHTEGLNFQVPRLQSVPPSPNV